MKWTTIIILLFGLIACDNRTDKNVVDDKVKTVHIDSLHIDRDEINGAGGQPYKESHNCNFDEFIVDKKTSKLAKDIYLNNEWNLGKDDEALALLDSLKAKNKHLRPFYCKILSLTIKKTDGYFSEALGLIGKEYVENNSVEFVNNFNYTECFTKDDLNNWADIVMLELGMYGEELATNNVVEDYIKSFRANCRKCNIEQKEISENFCQLLLNKKNKLILEIKNNKKLNR
jgi:hypothetical protein